ncbi:MAG: acyltransferase family protein [Eggerthellaceae bacterium]
MDNRYSRDQYGNGSNARKQQAGRGGARDSRNGEFEFEPNILYRGQDAGDYSRNRYGQRGNANSKRSSQGAESKRPSVKGASRHVPEYRADSPAEKASRPRKPESESRARALEGAGKVLRNPAPEARSAEQAQDPTRKAAPEPASEKKKGRYIPALDGLRAFAVLAVIAYHMGFAWAPSGLLGVTVFFVLSGYLITSLLLIEWDNNGRINLPQFWLRRVRRLFPAIVFVIMCSAALFTIFDHSLLTKLREDLAAALLWFTNWWYILRDVSYFEALGAPSPLTHFWSLAIEEQFYLVWPLIMVGCHKLGLSRKAMGGGTLVLALLSALEMALLFSPDADPSRVYYGTDTRAFSLLIGGFMAFAWPSVRPGGQDGRTLSKNARTALDGAGVAAFAGLVIMIATLDDNSPFLYHGGLLLASMLTAVVIAALAHPESIFARVMAAKPLVWIGVRSYGIYLWHYPLLLLMIPVSKVTDTPWYLYPVILAVIFACAAFSYRFVENPIRRGALGRFAKQIREHRTTIPAWLRTHILPTAVTGALACVCIGGLIAVPDTSAIEGADLLTEEGPQVAGLDSLETGDAASTSETPKLDVLLIGDSVSVRSIPYFQETFPYGAIDAEINRWFGTGIEVFQGYLDQDVVGDVVVFALGTNGPVSDEEFDELMKLAGPDREVFFVNTRSPQSWVLESNEALQRGAERYANAHIIDWYNTSYGRGELFDGDGTHLSEEGAQFYISMIDDAIAPYLPEHAEGDQRVDLAGTGLGGEQSQQDGSGQTDPDRAEAAQTMGELGA